MKIRSRLLIFNLTMISATAIILGATFFIFAEKYLHILALREIGATSRQAVSVVEQFFELRLAEQKTLSRSTFFFRELEFEQIESRFNDYRNFFRAINRSASMDRTASDVSTSIEPTSANKGHPNTCLMKPKNLTNRSICSNFLIH